MDDIPFYRTRMGQTFYEHTMPELVREIARLNELLAKLTVQLEEKAEDR